MDEQKLLDELRQLRDLALILSYIREFSEAQNEKRDETDEYYSNTTKPKPNTEDEFDEETYLGYHNDESSDNCNEEKEEDNIEGDGVPSDTDEQSNSLSKKMLLACEDALFWTLYNKFPDFSIFEEYKKCPSNTKAEKTEKENVYIKTRMELTDNAYNYLFHYQGEKNFEDYIKEDILNQKVEKNTKDLIFIHKNESYMNDIPAPIDDSDVDKNNEKTEDSLNKIKNSMSPQMYAAYKEYVDKIQRDEQKAILDSKEIESHLDNVLLDQIYKVIGFPAPKEYIIELIKTAMEQINTIH